MSNPTDPYSRPDSGDEDRDILDPLPAQEEGSAKLDDNNDLKSTRAWSPEGDDLPARARAAEREAWDEAFNAPVEPSAPSAPRPEADEPREFEQVSEDKYKSGTFAPVTSERDDSDERADSGRDSSVDPGGESIFGEPRTERAEPAREERGAETKDSIFDRDGRDSIFDRDRGDLSRADDATVVDSYEDEATRVTPAAAAGGEDVELSSAPVTPQRTSVFDRTTGPSATSTPYTGSSESAASPAGVSDRQVRRAVTPVPAEPSGRGWTHVGVFFATLILAPFAWYLMSDAGIRLGVLSESQWETGNLDWMSLLEFLGALLCVGVLWYLAAQSSFAPVLFGFILFAAGMAALFAPTPAQDLLATNVVENFRGINAFTGNVVHHLQVDLATGRIAIYGFLLFMTGIVAHSARRSGEERGNIMGRRKVLLSKKDKS